MMIIDCIWWWHGITGVNPEGVIDVSDRFNYRRLIGIKQAVALLFGKQFVKSITITRYTNTIIRLI